MTRKSSERSLSDLVSLCSANGGDIILKNFVSNDGQDDLVLHEFFFTPNAETNKYAIKRFIQKNFHVFADDIEVLATGNTKALVFKFSAQLHAPSTKQNFNCNVVYFLSVLSELDLLRHKGIVDLLIKHASNDCLNTFLFVAYPKGENGFNKAIQLPESELRLLGLRLREEINKTLKNTDIAIQNVDLMISRPSYPPLYTQYDFSAQEKLELFRLPAGAELYSLPATEDVLSSSPYLLFKHNDHDLTRIFVRCLIRDIASVLVQDKYLFAK